MAKQQNAPTQRRQSRQPRRWLRIGIAGAILILWRNNPSTAEVDMEVALPTPIGFPDTAQDVGTKVGQPAPAFTLSDETGQPVTVTPGQTGRPTVLVFNMGLG